MPLGSYLLSWVSALEHSNSMILLSVLEIVSIVLLSVCLDLGSLIIGLCVGLRISSAAEVLGHAQQICVGFKFVGCLPAVISNGNFLSVG